MKIISKRGREGFKTTLSKEQISELLKCASDPLYFMRRHVQLPSSSSNSNTCQMRLQNHHVDYVSIVNSKNHVIAVMPRQSGMTTMSLAFVLWEALYKLNHRVAVFGTGQNMTNNMYNIVTHMLSHLPAHLRPTIKGNRRSYIEFDNGSSLIFESLNVNSMRGRTLNRVFLDSFASTAEIIQRVIYNDICATMILGGKILMTSTPRGSNNTFAAAWKDAFKPSSSFTPFRKTINDMSFSDSWKKTTRAKVGEDVWRQEYMCEFI